MTTITSASTRPETATTIPDRVAATAGIAFVVLNVAGTFGAGSMPASDATPAKITAYFQDHTSALKVGQLAGALGVAALLWWFGAVWHRVRGDEPSRLSAVPVVSLSIALPLALLCGAIYSVLALRVDTLSASEVQLLWTLSAVIISVVAIGMGTFIAATCVLSHRNGAFPAWTNYLGGLAAVVFLANTTAMLTTSASVNSLTFVGFAGLCLWIVCVSGVLWQER